jgi:prepilin-type processing-associated H-X9-DG protein
VLSRTSRLDIPPAANYLYFDNHVETQQEAGKAIRA